MVQFFLDLTGLRYGPYCNMMIIYFRFKPTNSQLRIYLVHYIYSIRIVLLLAHFYYTFLAAKTSVNTYFLNKNDFT